MPIYAFQCEACGHRFEDIKPVGVENTECLKCGVKRATRVLDYRGVSIHANYDLGNARFNRGQVRQ